MTSLHTIVAQQQHPTRLYLHKEGNFLRAYEHSAFHFVHHIKPYQVLKRYFKVVRQEIAYLGFPLHTLATHLATASSKGFTIAEQTDTLVCLHGFAPPADFDRWKQQQPLSTAAPAAPNAQPPGMVYPPPPPPVATRTHCPACAALCEQLRHLDLSQINFNQCLIFLHNLKTLLL